MAKLMNCPFCGSSNVKCKYQCGAACVMCDNCDACGPIFRIPNNQRKQRKMAMEGWNCRKDHLASNSLHANSCSCQVVANVSDTINHLPPGSPAPWFAPMQEHWHSCFWAFQHMGEHFSWILYGWIMYSFLCLSRVCSTRELNQALGTFQHLNCWSHSGFLFLSCDNQERLSLENGSFSNTSPLVGGRYITGINVWRQTASIVLLWFGILLV